MKGKKSLPIFLQELKYNENKKESLKYAENRAFIFETLRIFDRLHVQSLTNRELTELYRRGFTFKELEKMTGRPFQSIRVSLSRYLKDSDIQDHKNYRKFWVRLQNYFHFVYDTDRTQSWDTLKEMFPDEDLPLLKQRYRLAGGRLMFDLTKQRQEENRALEERQVHNLRMSGVPTSEIAKILGIPISTVYLRLQSLDEAQAQEEQAQEEHAQAEQD